MAGRFQNNAAKYFRVYCLIFVKNGILIFQIDYSIMHFFVKSADFDYLFVYRNFLINNS